MLSGQGFFSTIVSEASAYASHAKKTIRYYKDGERRECPKLRCWGCSGDQSWMKQGKIVCPQGMDPQVIKTADQQYAEFKEEQAKRSTKPKGKGRKTIEYKDLDKKSNKKMRKAVLAITADERKAALSVNTASLSTAPEPGLAVFMLSTLSVPVFNITLPPRSILLVPIQAALPHITFQLGTILGCANCPAIWCVVNTAGALTTSNLHFFMALAKAYPHTVVSIHGPTDYSPITLSGIVQQGRASVTMDLTVGFQFTLPYFTCKGTPTNLIIAAGSNVTVNIILRLPFITQTKMIIDTSDQVAEFWVFNTPPFPIDFQRAMCVIPVVEEARAAANAAKYVDFVRKVKGIKEHISRKKGTSLLADAKQKANSILFLAKQAKAVKFTNTSIDGQCYTYK
jgi:hypothetical protein